MHRFMGCFKHRTSKLFIGIFIFSLIICCSNNSIQSKSNPIPNQIKTNFYYLGADLSYVNEVEDFGAIYSKNGNSVDPFQLFSEKGANIVRVRLWHTSPTEYSDFKDISKTIERSKKENMQVLLDFHYSDFWADPEKQIVPEAWRHISDTKILADSVYNYTYSTLKNLIKNNLTPELVQVGNETNIEILQQKNNTHNTTIDWVRNSTLLKAGIKAVNDINTENNLEIKKVLHIAQPENAIPWFEKAFEHGISDFDIIGLSYYPKWSTYSLDEIPIAIQSLKRTFNKDVLIVETAYPHSLKNVDKANNIMGEDALISGYPATPQGQLNYLKDLNKKVKLGNGIGVIYWEPAWISSNATTAWGEGSHWDNATFFDAFNNNEALPAFEIFNLK